jgi:hypothetical protein
MSGVNEESEKVLVITAGNYDEGIPLLAEGYSPVAALAEMANELDFSEPAFACEVCLVSCGDG